MHASDGVDDGSQSSEEAEDKYVLLLGRELRYDDLVVPESTTERYDVVAANGEGMGKHRIYATALAFTWRWLRRKLQSERIVFKGNIALFSQQALDWLLGQGVTYQELAGAGDYALLIIGTDLPGLDLPQTDAELEEVTGNSLRAEGSTS